MGRRARGDGEPVKTRRREAITPKRRNGSKVAQAIVVLRLLTEKQ
jgi:hypothetical protein